MTAIDWRKRTVPGFMCLTDFAHELGNVCVKVYASEEALREARDCVDTCGVMEILVVGIKVIQESNFHGSKE